jgi:hypothetical protein
MAIWQHDYHLIPQSKLLEHYGRIPETISNDDYNRIDWWGGMAEPNRHEIEHVLLPTKNWCDYILNWGSDRGDRLTLYYGHKDTGDEGLLLSVELRFDMRRETPEVRNFVLAMVGLAKKYEWCFCTDKNAILLPDYDTLAKDMSLSKAQDFVTNDPAAPLMDQF